MKVKVIIEEVISQTFEVDIDDMDNAYDQVRSKYLNNELVIDNPGLTAANIMIFDENGNETDWSDLHIP